MFQNLRFSSLAILAGCVFFGWVGQAQWKTAEKGSITGGSALPGLEHGNIGKSGKPGKFHPTPTPTRLRQSGGILDYQKLLERFKSLDPDDKREAIIKLESVLGQMRADADLKRSSSHFPPPLKYAPPERKKTAKPLTDKLRTKDRKMLAPSTADALASGRLKGTTPYTSRLKVPAKREP